MLDEVIGQRAQKRHGILAEFPWAHDELDVPHIGSGVGHHQRVGQHTDVALTTQQHSHLIGGRTCIQKNGIPFVDIFHALGRNALFLSCVDLTLKAHVALKQ